MNLSATGPGGSLTDETPYRFIVGLDGELTGYSPGLNSQSGVSCDSPTRTYLTGNVAYLRVDSAEGYSCTLPGIGTCRISGESRATFGATAASDSGTWKYSCPTGVLTVEFSGILYKVG
jgi:hypothetical protein